MTYIGPGRPESRAETERIEALKTPTFIVTRTYMCAIEIARREGLPGPRSMVWLTGDSMHKIRSADAPTVWVAPCGRDSMSAADLEMIESRRPVLSSVTCFGDAPTRPVDPPEPERRPEPERPKEPRDPREDWW